MKIFVKSLPVEEVMKDLSAELEVAYEQDAGELTLELPERVGKGFIRGTSFSSGVGFIQYFATFNEDIEIHFTLNDTHPLKFIFCSEGRVKHSFAENNNEHIIDTFQNVIVSSTGHNGHVLHFKANETANVSSLEIIRSKFVQRSNHDFKGLVPKLQNLFRDVIARELFYYHGNYSIQVADIVEDINRKDTEGFLRSIFVEGKIYEMLTKQITQYQDDQAEGSNTLLIRRSDVEKVRKAVDLIKSNLDKNFSVDHLAKEVGTNVNKLQEGFKYMYDLTVNKYMQQVKLEAAKELLSTTDHNISQIVGMIGLNNRSYFSKIFKEKYGVSPKYFLKSKYEQVEEEQD